MSTIFAYEPFYDLDRFFEDWRNTGTASTRPKLLETGEGNVKTLRPRMDLHEDTEKNVVTAIFELPGIKKEDVHIDINNNRLTVWAENKMSEEHEENGYAIRERRFGKFTRTLQLPSGTQDKDIKASMENGVLSVTFPKVGSEETSKRITIQ
ncbi:small heat shock protein [Macrolepiota fuliginosa MF-IS2]|uniref:Small heat shock protein n=1 Tax=Macrolepiota fuliginosa MF-IS2 TaxID=1400762 RepID=A0A9P5XER4_9AGAR|nr:small heat shock protein [Macrolepiota fuliginosa MF-IS2]